MEIHEAETKYAKGSDSELEAATDARLDDAESLKSEARRDGIKDVAREALIDHLEASGDLVEDALKDHPVGAFRGERKTSDRKINPARMDKGWYGKTERTQRRMLQKKLGSYRPEPDDPVNQKPHAKGVAEGRLFDPHPLLEVRKRDVDATGTIKAATPPPLPVRPAPDHEPIPGRCWWDYKPLRKRDRAGTKFCTDNKGKCRRAWNAHEADRAAITEIFNEWSASRHGGRILSIHQAAAEAMFSSAARCGIKEGTFMATADGVLATHDAPLPPIELQGSVRVAAVDGYARHEVGIIATQADGGTLYMFEMNFRPEGDAVDVRLRFEGDPGIDCPYEGYGSPAPVLPRMSAMYAARTGRVSEFLAARQRDLAA
jgi:hypothetical protein